MLDHSASLTLRLPPLHRTKAPGPAPRAPERGISYTANVGESHATVLTKWRRGKGVARARDEEVVPPSLPFPPSLPPGPGTGGSDSRRSQMCLRGPGSASQETEDGGVARSAEPLVRRHIRDRNGKARVARPGGEEVWPWLAHALRSSSVFCPHRNDEGPDWRFALNTQRTSVSNLSERSRSKPGSIHTSPLKSRFYWLFFHQLGEKVKKYFFSTPPPKRTPQKPPAHFLLTWVPKRESLKGHMFQILSLSYLYLLKKTGLPLKISKFRSK